MLLNKIPTLDKGFVAFVESMNNGDKLKALSLEFFKSTDITNVVDMAQLTLVIKCPLFVHLNLSKFDLRIVSTPTNTIEAYIPNLGEIGGQDRETNRLIADDIERTTEALLINPKSYQSDGCDRFISQVMTPINVYTTLIVQGSYKEFQRFCNQASVPEPVKSYTVAVKSIIDMEWR